MPVFMEKNGVIEGANPLCGPAGVRCAPAGPALTSRSAAVGKTRLETLPGQYPTRHILSSHLPSPCGFLRPDLTAEGIAIHKLTYEERRWQQEKH